MSVTIELTPEAEESFAALAKEQGISLSDYLSRILSAKSESHADLSPAERARLWRESVLGLAGDVTLSDEAMRRESFYGDRS